MSPERAEAAPGSAGEGAGVAGAAGGAGAGPGPAGAGAVPGSGGAGAVPGSGGAGAVPGSGGGARTGLVSGAVGAVLGGDTPALAARDVWVHFGGVQALRAVSITAPAGQVTGLIGPNGAGKTTLFNVLTGMQRADRGRVELGTRDVTEWGPHRRARAGLARTFQRLELFWSLSVADNVRVAAEAPVRGWQRRWRGAHQANPARPSVTAVMERVGLADVAGWPVDRLPTGRARLVELARALALAPSVLLLDEPGSGLDDAESAALGAVLRDLAAGGMAVVLVEHDMALVMDVCTTVHVLDAGQQVAVGSPVEVQADPVVQAAYLGSPA